MDYSKKVFESQKIINGGVFVKGQFSFFGVSIGVCVGIAVGIVFKNLLIGISMSICLGVVFNNLYLDKK